MTTLDWHRTIGSERIEERCRALARYCRDQLSHLKGFQIISPSDPELYSGIVSILLDEASNREIFNKMKAEDIIIKLLPKYNALRFSMHMFNTREDVDRLVTNLERILKA